MFCFCQWLPKTPRQGWLVMGLAVICTVGLFGEAQAASQAQTLIGHVQNIDLRRVAHAVELRDHEGLFITGLD